MDEPEVQYLLQPSFECLGSNKPSIFMIVMTLSAPKNFEARKIDPFGNRLTFTDTRCS